MSDELVVRARGYAQHLAETGNIELGSVIDALATALSEEREQRERLEEALLGASAFIAEERERAEKLRYALGRLLGCIVETPAGELELVPLSQDEVEEARQALVAQESGE